MIHPENRVVLEQGSSTGTTLRMSVGHAHPLCFIPRALYEKLGQVESHVPPLHSAAVLRSGVALFCSTYNVTKPGFFEIFQARQSSRSDSGINYDQSARRRRSIKLALEKERGVQKRGTPQRRTKKRKGTRFLLYLGCCPNMHAMMRLGNVFQRTLKRKSMPKVPGAGANAQLRPKRILQLQQCCMAPAG